MTHQDITDPVIRKVYANELNVLRHAARSGRESSFFKAWFSGVLTGLDTAFRRLDKIGYRETTTVS